MYGDWPFLACPNPDPLSIGLDKWNTPFLAAAPWTPRSGARVFWRAHFEKHVVSFFDLLFGVYTPWEVPHLFKH